MRLPDRHYAGLPVPTRIDGGGIRETRAQSSSRQIATAALEVAVGLMLLTGRMLRTGLVLLGGCALGFLSRLVLFCHDMFPVTRPTLEARYNRKDIVLAAAGLVVAAKVWSVRRFR